MGRANIILVSALFLMICFAEQWEFPWRTISIAESKDGELIIIGTVEYEPYDSFGTVAVPESSKAFAIKMDRSGNKIWERTYRNYTTGEHIVPAFNGGCLILGAMWEDMWGKSDAHRPSLYGVRISEEGNKIDEYTWRCSGKEVNNSYLITTTDSSYIFLENIMDSYYKGVLCLWKIDRNGKLNWKHRYEIDDWRQVIATKVLESKAGGFIIYGLALTEPPLDSSMQFIIETDRNGKYVRKYENLYRRKSNEYYIRGLCLSKDNNPIVALTYFESESLPRVLLLREINLAGNIIWEKELLDSCRIWTFGEIARTSDNGFLLVGTLGNSINEQKLFSIRTDSLGDVLWEHTYSDFNHHYPKRIIQVGGNEILIFGNKMLPKRYGSGSFIIWVDSLGNPIN